ncbi:NAD(P)/FAD-dependent oxidoreductase [Ammoniphilus sp. CFH 90114]|uniref:phytoene desaturase family protein n=1 Tax=Ammoniphilus sp. CFH 90114 TaxID=2493665 RepID=UPI001F0CAE3C|nr:NAD(P)/FAD-dependent oxidoreductase [Ammoniphilus sp. CFH 90114]
MYDAIIIGSGHNGLIAGAYLAKSGWKVAVVERNSEIGGACQTRELTIPGFKHDPFAASHVLFYGSPIYAEFGKELETYGLKYKTATHSFASLFPGGESISAYSDVERTIRELSQKSKADAETWLELINFFGEAADGFGSLLYNEIPSWGTAKSIYALYRKLGKERFMDFGQTLAKTPKQMAMSHFEHQQVQSWFTAWAYHPDFDPNTAFGAMFAYSTMAALQVMGNPVAEGGSGKMPEAFGKMIEAYGGKIYRNTPVTKIHIRNNRAVAIEANGDVMEARKAIIAGLEPKQLYLNLIGESHLPTGFVKKVKRYRYGHAQMKLDIALDGDPGWEAGSELGNACYVHLAPFVEDIEKTAYSTNIGMLPESPLVVVGQQSAVDPTRAPEGKHTLWVQVRTVPYEIKGDMAGEIKGTDWDEIKEQYTERIIKKIASYAPGIESKILGVHTMTPKDLERENPNLREGCIGGSHHFDQNFMFRPFPGYSRFNTPFNNLYMIGAATWPGSALHGGSGYMIAKKLLKK